MDRASSPPRRAAGLLGVCRLSLLAAVSSLRKPQMGRVASFSKTPEKLLLRCEMFAPTAGEYHYRRVVISRVLSVPLRRLPPVHLPANLSRRRFSETTTVLFLHPSRCPWIPTLP